MTAYPISVLVRVDSAVVSGGGLSTVPDVAL